jgi:hypothetical protein
MPDTIPRLGVARPDDPPATPLRPHLRPLALLQVAQAERFLTDLERDTAQLTGAEPECAAFLLGQAQVHLARLSDIVRAVTGLPR